MKYIAKKTVLKDRRQSKDRRNFGLRMGLLRKYCELSHLSKEDISKELNISIDVIKRISIDANEDDGKVVYYDKNNI